MKKEQEKKLHEDIDKAANAIAQKMCQADYIERSIAWQNEMLQKMAYVLTAIAEKVGVTSEDVIKQAHNSDNESQCSDDQSGNSDA